MNFTVREHEIFPDEFPESWASDWGEDEYGLFMGFTYKGVRQDFRWIEPGTFLMGSPKDEPERRANEIQHAVTLGNGFWLADTVVTQALWEVAMGDSPSHFQGSIRPVEQISWQDVQTFIDKMNTLKPDLQLCLPAESQWEYACRAGTASRYYFGDELTSVQANFNASETVDVKAYAPNSWGLYQMHGNVWEWCHDWLTRYPVDSVDTTTDLDAAGTRRVLRGGSWVNVVEDCRSAFRDSATPVYRNNLIGFRLARCVKLA